MKRAIKKKRTIKKDKGREAVQEINTLPFVDTTKKGIHSGRFWNVKPTGDYLKDCETGARYAEKCLDLMAKHQLSPLFNWVIFDMGNIKGRKKHTGIEAGFLSWFAEKFMFWGFFSNLLLDKSGKADVRARIAKQTKELAEAGEI